MTYFSIAFLCCGALFFILLTDRFHFWATAISTAVVYILSLGISQVVSFVVDTPELSTSLSFFLGAGLFFLSSLVLYTNNFMQKLFLLLLSIGNFAFLSFFSVLLLGIMPFSTSGPLGGILTVLLNLLFTTLLCLCLYRPFRFYSGRNVSGFIVGACLIQIFLCLFAFGPLDFLFRGHVLAARLLCVALLYGLEIFAFRSILHAGQYQERLANESARRRILEMEAADFSDMLASLKEVRAAQKSSEYALDTVLVLHKDGNGDQIPAYIETAKKAGASSPMLNEYHENPYINGVLATKAALSSQTGIRFESSALTGKTPLTTGEICIIINEMLTKACMEAARYKDGEKKVHFSIVPTEDSLIFETIYTATIPAPEKFTLKGKKLSDVLAWLFDDSPEEDPASHLESTAEIINLYSGKVTISTTAQETILRVVIQY